MHSVLSLLHGSQHMIRLEDFFKVWIRIGCWCVLARAWLFMMCCTWSILTYPILSWCVLLCIYYTCYTTFMMLCDHSFSLVSDLSCILPLRIVLDYSSCPFITLFSCCCMVLSFGSGSVVCIVCWYEINSWAFVL